MNRWSYRLAIGLTALAAVASQAPAQEMVPPAKEILVPPAKEILVPPAVQYEPARPQPLQPPTILQAGHLQELTPNVPSTQPPLQLDPPPRDGIYRFWGRLDYLAWWISRPPIGVPLVTSSTPTGIGATTEPGATVLFGNGSDQRPSFGAFSGTRITIGGWLESNYEYGWEFGGFVLERRSNFFNASSTATSGVSIPFNATAPFNGNPAGETSLNSGGAPSTATVQLTSQMWGLELNELAYAWANDNCYFTAVLGARYLNINENLTLSYTVSDVVTKGNTVTTDGFGTHNQFFAGQFGFRTGGTLGRFTFDTSAMLMCGPMREVLNIAGGTTVTGGAFGFANGTTPGGIFAEPSNIGNHTRGVIAVGSELQLKAGYAITRYIQPYVAYNVIYLNNVARPGNQIDRNINPTQNAFFVPPGTLTGSAAPLAGIHGSDLWVHGLQFGIELRY
jgi:hypothetical protein